MQESAPRRCPRCSGSMISERDMYGTYSSCIACGYVDEWVSGPAIDLPDDSDSAPRQRRRQPSHGKLRL